MPVEDREITSQHIVEIRYRALAKVLDIRGLIADSVSERLDLRYWSITQDRVDFKVTEESDHERAFVSHRNLGYSVRRPDTRHYFPDRASRFVHELLRVDGFELRPIMRFGVRARVLLPYRGNFETLLARFNQLLPVPENQTRPFNAQVEDIGPVVVLRRGNIRLRVQIGPMPLEQSKALFQGHEDLPEVGLFIDLDQYQENVGRMEERDISGLLRTLHGRSWEAIDFYNRLVL